jgi:hypothetical protein
MNMLDSGMTELAGKIINRHLRGPLGDNIICPAKDCEACRRDFRECGTIRGTIWEEAMRNITAELMNHPEAAEYLAEMEDIRVSFPEGFIEEVHRDIEYLLLKGIAYS